MSVTGIITDISRGSFHDGPGSRTVVYFKGCDLRCRWCHNPETYSVKKDIIYLETKCVKCGRCVDAFPECHRITDDRLVIDRKRCIKCGKCSELCPVNALQIIGKEYTVEDVMRIVRKDKHFYLQSGGGVTLSGGECLLQSDFTEKVLSECKSEGINTAIETALYVPWKNVEQVIPYTDLFFADLKIVDSEKHLHYTGKDNGLILENLKKLTETASNVIVRIPVIPTVNDTDLDIDGFSSVIKTLGPGLKSVELLKYNNLAESKYNSLGLKYTQFSSEIQTDEWINEMYTKIMSCKI